MFAGTIGAVGERPASGLHAAPQRNLAPAPTGGEARQRLQSLRCVRANSKTRSSPRVQPHVVVRLRQNQATNPAPSAAKDATLGSGIAWSEKRMVSRKPPPSGGAVKRNSPI